MLALHHLSWGWTVGPLRGRQGLQSGCRMSLQERTGRRVGAGPTMSSLQSGPAAQVTKVSGQTDGQGLSHFVLRWAAGEGVAGQRVTGSGPDPQGPQKGSQGGTRAVRCPGLPFDEP